MTDTIEKHLIRLAAADRIDMVVSSMAGKSRRYKQGLTEEVSLAQGESFNGNRVYARVEAENRNRARGLREGIEKFKEQYPREGRALEKCIAQERERTEVHLYIGVNKGSRLTSRDYLEVLDNLGFSGQVAAKLLPGLVEASYRIAGKRDGERSILIG